MAERKMRDYEVSIWSLQDDFIAVLKTAYVENKGQISEPKITLKTDGTQNIRFSIPMYLYQDGVRVANPAWYNTRNGNLIINMRKIKVIFNKYTEDERIFDFMITKVTERHEDDQLYCDVEAEGLAFNELGKTGYKISLSSQQFYDEDYELTKQQQPTNNSEIVDGEAQEPEQLHATIDYWLKKMNLQPVPTDNKLINANTWYYVIKMDWSSYADGNDAEKRAEDKIYEEPYVSSWQASDDNSTVLVPKAIETYKEKERLLDVEESNIYNLTQTLAETFGVFCRYEYLYDDNYHITGRRIIFYNNYMQEKLGYLSLTYPTSTNSISREIDSNDTITKLYVKPVTNVNSDSGWSTITNVGANKSMEDYILNFEYMHDTGAITAGQYAEIKKYEEAMHNYNTQMLPLEQKIEGLNARLPEVEGQKALAKTAKQLDQERLTAANGLLDQLDIEDGNNDGRISINPATPVTVIGLEDSSKNDGSYYITLSDKGIYLDTLQIYRKFDVVSRQLDDPIQTGIPEYDEFGNLYRIRNLYYNNMVGENESHLLYLTYDYTPKTYYDNVVKTWEARLEKDTADEQRLGTEVDRIKNELEEYNTQLQTLLDNKQKAVTDFETMMGPALREGYWQPDNYKDYGDNYIDTFTSHRAENETEKDQDIFEAAQLDDKNFSSHHTKLLWDETLFDDEVKNCYEFGVNLEKKYYPCVRLNSTIIKKLNEPIQEGSDTKRIDQLSFLFYNNKVVSADQRTAKDKQAFALGSQAQLGFVKKITGTSEGQNTVTVSATPVLILTGAETLDDATSLLLQQVNNATTGQSVKTTTTITFSKLPSVVRSGWYGDFSSLVTDKDYGQLVQKPGTYNAETNTASYGFQKTTRVYESGNKIILPQPFDNNTIKITGFFDTNIDSDDTHTENKNNPLNKMPDLQGFYYPATSGTSVVIPVDPEDPSVVPATSTENITVTDVTTETGETYRQVTRQNAVPELRFLLYYYDKNNVLIAIENAEASTDTIAVSDITEQVLSSHTIVLDKDFIIPEGACSAKLVFETDTTLRTAPVFTIEHTISTLSDNFSADPALGRLVITKEGEVRKVEEEKYVEGENISWISIQDSPAIIYPRIEIDSLFLKTSDQELVIQYNGETLKNYEDYYITSRENKYYITFKPDFIIRHADKDGNILNGQLLIKYTLSNADTSIYLDALQVAKENSRPKISYQVRPSMVNEDFIYNDYDKLARIVNINDIDLNFENVQGYISDVDLDLDEPWNDSVTVQNYKSKFEDLFSTIVAQTEAMKKSEYTISLAGTLFMSNGQLSGQVVQDSLKEVDLNYAFNNGKLTIDDRNGIVGLSDAGVVAMRGGGIFTATEKDPDGNWIWNTGIVPQGINADLITTGQLDTNRIKIYAGDRAQFQLNGKGLYAYKLFAQDTDLSAGMSAAVRSNLTFDGLDPTQYVVFNSEGLFLTADRGAVVLNENRSDFVTVMNKVNRVEISWDGLVLRNYDGDKTLYADPDTGNLFLSGTVYADAFHVIQKIYNKETGKYEYSSPLTLTDYVTQGLRTELDSHIDKSTALLQMFADAGEAINNALTTHDASYAAGSVQEAIFDQINSKTHTIKNTEPKPSRNVTVGDILIIKDKTTGKELERYIATTTADNANTDVWTRVYDGRIQSIEGASMNVNASTGKITLEAEHTISLTAKGAIDFTGNDINLTGNNSINIGSKWINVAAGNGGGINITSVSMPTGSIMSTNGQGKPTATNAVSYVSLDQRGITMTASRISMIAATSYGGAGMSIDPASGITMASTQKIELQAMPTMVMPNTYTYIDDEGTTHTDENTKDNGGKLTAAGEAWQKWYDEQTTSALSLQHDKIYFGVINDTYTGSVVEITKNRIYLGSKNKTEVGSVSITPDEVLIGQVGDSGQTGAGGFIRINRSQLEIASGARLYIDAENIKLDSVSGMAEDNGLDDDENSTLQRIQAKDEAARSKEEKEQLQELLNKINTYDVGFRLGSKQDPKLKFARGDLTIDGTIYARNLFVGNQAASWDTQVDSKIPTTRTLTQILDNNVTEGWIRDYKPGDLLYMTSDDDGVQIYEAKKAWADSPYNKPGITPTWGQLKTAEEWKLVGSYTPKDPGAQVFTDSDIDTSKVRVGDVWYTTEQERAVVKIATAVNGTTITWQTQTLSPNHTYTSSIYPTNFKANDYWYDTSDSIVKIWRAIKDYDANWSEADANLYWKEVPITAPEGAKTSMGNDMPCIFNIGDIWYDTASTETKLKEASKNSADILTFYTVTQVSSITDITDFAEGDCYYVILENGFELYQAQKNADTTWKDADDKERASLTSIYFTQISSNNRASSLREVTVEKPYYYHESSNALYKLKTTTDDQSITTAPNGLPIEAWIEKTLLGGADGNKTYYGPAATTIVNGKSQIHPQGISIDSATEGDLWYRTDNHYNADNTTLQYTDIRHYRFTVTEPAGDTVNEWREITPTKITGAALAVDSNAGTITLNASNTISLTSQDLILSATNGALIMRGPTIKMQYAEGTGSPKFIDRLIINNEGITMHAGTDFNVDSGAIHLTAPSAKIEFEDKATNKKITISPGEITSTTGIFTDLLQYKASEVVTKDWVPLRIQVIPETQDPTIFPENSLCIKYTVRSTETRSQLLITSLLYYTTLEKATLSNQFDYDLSNSQSNGNPTGLVFACTGAGTNDYSSSGPVSTTYDVAITFDMVTWVPNNKWSQVKPARGYFRATLLPSNEVIQSSTVDVLNSQKITLQRQVATDPRMRDQNNKITGTIRVKIDFVPERQNNTDGSWVDPIGYSPDNSGGYTYSFNNPQYPNIRINHGSTVRVYVMPYGVTGTPSGFGSILFVKGSAT